MKQRILIILFFLETKIFRKVQDTQPLIEFKNISMQKQNDLKKNLVYLYYIWSVHRTNNKNNWNIIPNLQKFFVSSVCVCATTTHLKTVQSKIASGEIGFANDKVDFHYINTISREKTFYRKRIKNHRYIHRIKYVAVGLIVLRTASNFSKHEKGKLV